MQIEISIIIPVYNCGLYLKECLESVLGQTFSKIEVICVDDCSTDTSGEILSEYAKKDKRIKLIHNARSLKAGGSRNEGLKAAIGKYVIFLDGDDFFEPDMLEVSYRQIEQSRAQVAVFYYDRYNNERKRFSPGVFQENINRILIPTYPLMDNVKEVPYLFQTVLNNPWTKLIDREWLIRTGIRFPDLGNVEDVTFSYNIFAAAQRVIFIDKRFVHYRQMGQNGLTKDSFHKKVFIVEAYREVYGYLLSVNIFRKLEKSFANAMIRCILGYFQDGRTSENVRKEIKAEFYSFYKETLKALQWTQEMFFNPGLYEFYQYLIGKQEEKEGWNLYESCTKYSQLINYIKENSYTLALWGAGEWGKQFLTAYQKQGADVDYVIDSDRRKRGEEFMRHRVCAYEDVRNQVDVIIVTNPFWISDIMNEVSDSQKQFINLYPFIEYDCNLQAVIERLQ